MPIILKIIIGLCLIGGFIFGMVDSDNMKAFVASKLIALLLFAVLIKLWERKRKEGKNDFTIY